MNGRELLQKSPNLIIALAACGTFLATAVIAAMVILSLNGGDTEAISGFVNTLLNFVAVILTSGAAVAAGAAAKNSQEAKETAQKAVDQTNGPMTRQFDELKQSVAEVRSEANERDPLM